MSENIRCCYLCCGPIYYARGKNKTKTERRRQKTKTKTKKKPTKEKIGKKNTRILFPWIKIHETQTKRLPLPRSAPWQLNPKGIEPSPPRASDPSSIPYTAPRCCCCCSFLAGAAATCSGSVLGKNDQYTVFVSDSYAVTHLSNDRYTIQRRLRKKYQSVEGKIT